MEFGFLHELGKEHDVTALLKEHFEFNKKKRLWQLRKNTKFKTQIPLEARIKYYLLSYMRQMQRLKLHPRFDDIVLNIMPLLKNGITPKHQTILGVLRNVAEHVGDGRWKLVEGKQLELQWADGLPEVDPNRKKESAPVRWPASCQTVEKLS